MDKKVISVIIGIILLIAATFAYVLLQLPKSQSTNETPSSSTQKQEDAMPGTTTNDQPGSYVTYSEAAILDTVGTKLLFFHAPWCPQCRAMEASIESDGIPSGVTVFKVDYDSNQALRQKHGVTLQTTFVKIDDQGNKIASYVAYEEPQFSAVERELLR